MTKVIDVCVYGGSVQWVQGIPDGVEVRVYDYDVDGIEDTDLDQNDNPCTIIIYDGGDPAYVSIEKQEIA